MLATDVRGSGPRLVLVHGFTQSARCWGPVADDLAEDHEVVAVDAPGHGGSSGVSVAFETGAALIGEAGGRAVYVGYSMGGRYALRLALDRPDLVERLVLISASPGLADPADRETRRAADAALAGRIESVGVVAFVGAWLAQPLFAGLTADARFIEERCANTTAGLASSLRLAGTGAQLPLWDRLGELAMPVLIVTGEHDTKFTEVARRMAGGIGRPAQVEIVPGAGHTAHLENTPAFLAALRAWETRQDARTSPSASSTP